MDIEHKYKLLEKIMKTEDDVVLNEIDSLLNTTKQDFWPSLPSQVKQAIEEAASELDKGEGIPHEQVMAEIKEHYLKK
ncbi:MAG TPA: hypothetical protein VG367_08235 [Mucilaginibacter sp.]|jgi:hypothetical protein|nr:hypothetical protein [Mucilaginibacter sp.]